MGDKDNDKTREWNIKKLKKQSGERVEDLDESKQESEIES